jgi:hypothetical protein
MNDVHNTIASLTRLRKSMSLEFKRRVVLCIDNATQENGVSVYEASEELNLLHFYIIWWKKMLDKAAQKKKSRTFFTYNISRDSHQVHP